MEYFDLKIALIAANGKTKVNGLLMRIIFKGNFIIIVEYFRMILNSFKANIQEFVLKMNIFYLFIFIVNHVIS